MLDVASSKMPDLLAPETGDGEGADFAPGNPGTPPQSPSRYRKPSSGKEEDAMWSLMKLATPVKSPCLRAACGDSSAGGAAGNSAGGAEMTPVSLFNKSRQPGEMQSPFQSPFKNFQFSPSCLFSPPGAGTLDFPLAGGDTPGPASSGRSDPWQQTTPDRRVSHRGGGGEGKAARIGVAEVQGGGDGGVGDGDLGVEGGGVGGSTPGSCGKRKSKALFTDKRGPQDHHSHGLGGGGQGWCLGTPMRSTRESGVVHHHLGVTDIPATPDRTTGVDGSQVLPPTPQLLPPTTPSRVSREVTEAAEVGGDDAAGILMGLRSPESLSAFNGESGGIDQALFSGLDDAGGGGGHRGMAERSWSDDWGSSRGGGGAFVRDAPHSAPAKRHRSSIAVSLRDAHCKGSFTIERGTLIRSASSCSSSIGTSSSSNSSRSHSGSIGGSMSCGGGNETSRRATCQVRSRGQSIEEEPLSPPKPLLSPGPPPLAMSRPSVSLSPARPDAARRPAATGGTPSTSPWPSARGSRGDRSRRGAAGQQGATPVVAPNSDMASSIVTPSPAAAPTSRPGRSSVSKPTPPRAGSAVKVKVKGTPPRSSRACKAELEPSSFNSPEQTTSRRGAGGVSMPRLKQEKQGVTRVVPPTPSPPLPVTPASVAATSKRMRAAVAVAPGGSEGGGDPLTVKCNCKKSKCLKLYCECFQRQQFCVDCNCMDCLNTERTEDLRQLAIQVTIERNPQAFVSKFEKRAGKRSHNAGCNCKKSACLKKYCECFQAGVACGTNCKCVNCKNYEGAAGGRKRRAIEVPVSSAPRTPPRMSPRVRGAVVAAAAADVDGDSDDSSKAPPSSPDHHVQVGGDDEDDEDATPAPPLAEALRGGPLFSTGAVVSGNRGAVRGGGSGGFLPGSPPADAVAAAAAAFAAQNKARALGGAATVVTASSSSASAVADCAVARSLLDMGGTPLQVQNEEGAEAKFELSLAAGSPASARLLQGQHKGSPGGGGGPAYDTGIGMDALLSRFRKEASASKTTAAAVVAASAAAAAAAERAMMASAHSAAELPASAGGKAGGGARGQACLTPPLTLTTTTAWNAKGNAAGAKSTSGSAVVAI